MCLQQSFEGQAMIANFLQKKTQMSTCMYIYWNIKQVNYNQIECTNQENRWKFIRMIKQSKAINTNILNDRKRTIDNISFLIGFGWCFILSQLKYVYVSVFLLTLTVKNNSCARAFLN